MNIAVYHGFKIIHYEMLGYIIEYFLKSKINIDVFADTSLINDLEWEEYYNKLFNINLKWLNCDKFNPENYQYIILITDDDYSFKEEWLIKYGKNKVIIIDHSANIRRAENNVLARIGTRFFSKRPSCDWSLPCYYGITKIQKKNIIITNDKINVMCIGIQNRPPSITFLKKLFVNFNDIIFHIISRNIEDIYKACENIKTYLYCPTKIMFELVKKSNYILCIDNPNNSEPIANSMSGAIPIAFSYGCKLLIPSSWQKHYNFKSIIEYKEDTSLSLSNNIDLDLIYNELYYLISHRNKVFDNIIKINYLKKYYSEYGLILASSKLIIPNIIITENLVNNLFLDFREIHINKSTISDIPICYIYNDYLGPIYEPILKIYDLCSVNDIEKEIELISLRPYKDIIIIENIDSLNNTNRLINIIDIYNKNKYCVYYSLCLESGSKVIIYSF